MLTIETRQSTSKCYSFVLEPLIFRQLGEDVDEIKRRVHREVYVLAGNRVHKSQRSRVEHRPRAALGDGPGGGRRHNLVSPQKSRRRGLAASVCVVPDYGMPHLAAVHSNLMRPASLELPLHERGVTARQLHADAKVTDGLR